MSGFRKLGHKLGVNINFNYSLCLLRSYYVYKYIFIDIIVCIYICALFPVSCCLIVVVF